MSGNSDYFLPVKVRCSCSAFDFGYLCWVPSCILSVPSCSFGEQRQELFTTDLRGKHGLPSYGLKLVQWLESFPEACQHHRGLHPPFDECDQQEEPLGGCVCRPRVFAGQSISSECSACAPVLGSKTFTAPTARLQQESLVAVKPRDLPKDCCDLMCFHIKLSRKKEEHATVVGGPGEQR